MASSPRTVYFYEIAQLESDGIQTKNLETGFWPKFHEKTAKLDDESRRLVYYGRKMFGEARNSKSPVADYFYVGKARKGADWPDFSNADGTVSSLPINNDGNVALIEPAYLLPIDGTNYIAMIRTSGGPSVQAIQEWINSVMGMISRPETLILRAYVRRDDLARLKRAQGGARVHMKVDANKFDEVAPRGAMASAMKSVQRSMHGGASVEMIVSFGNAKPDNLASDELAEQVREMVDAEVASKLEATLFVPNEDGELVRDKIDFIADRFTAKEKVGQSDDTPISPAVMVSALQSAVRKFREKMHQ